MNKAIAVICLILGISLFMYAEYLVQPETYIFNYRLLFILLVTSLSTVIIQALLINSYKSELPIFSLLGAFGIYLILILISDFINSYISFQFDVDINSILYLICFSFYARELILYIGNQKIAVLVLLPVLMLTLYTFLASHDFFSQRAGSYPVYSSVLKQNIWFKDKVKSIEDFFLIDKTK